MSSFVTQGGCNTISIVVIRWAPKLSEDARSKLHGRPLNKYLIRTLHIAVKRHARDRRLLEQRPVRVGPPTLADLIGLSKYWGIHPIRAFYLSATLTYSQMQLPRCYVHLSLPFTSALPPSLSSSITLPAFQCARTSHCSSYCLFR